jgi:hypothetical protein
VARDGRARQRRQRLDAARAPCLKSGTWPSSAKGYEKWLKQAEKEAVNAYRGLAAWAFSYIVAETPEFSGESVANWRFSVGSPELSTEIGHQVEAPREDARKGDLAHRVRLQQAGLRRIVVGGRG